MSSSTSALKASRSIVDSYVSSTERSDLTTSFTENTPTLSDSLPKKNIIQTILGVVKHPKFKWIVIAVLLCVCVFVYFKSQNKQTKQANKEQIEDTRLDIIQDKDGRPILVDLKEKEYMDKISQLEQKEKQLNDKINQMNANNMRRNNMRSDNMRSDNNQHPNTQVPSTQKAQEAAQRAQEAAYRVQQEAAAAQKAQQEAAAAQRAQEEAYRAQQEAAAAQRAQQESESSEEVFIENENVMNHNLTRDEMNAIDKQLEDINIDDMGYESN
jgi:type III secretory pathway component EscV